MANDFAQGMGLGLNAYNQAVDNRRQQSGQDALIKDQETRRNFEERRLKLAEDEAGVTLPQKRKEYEFEAAKMQAEAKADQEATAALQEFVQATQALDPNSPSFVDDYDALATKTAVKAAGSKMISPMFDAIDKRFKGIKSYVNTKTAEANELSMMANLAKVAPDLYKMADAATKAGQPVDWTAITETLQKRNIDLRAASTNARIEGEKEGAFGGRNIDEVDKSELDLLSKRELEAAKDRALALQSMDGAADDKATMLARAAVARAEKEIRDIRARRQEIRQKVVNTNRPNSPAATQPVAAPTVRTQSGALPLPSDKSLLEPGQTYQTGRGEAVWDGTQFTR